MKVLVKTVVNQKLCNTCNMTDMYSAWCAN